MCQAVKKINLERQVNSGNKKGGRGARNAARLAACSPSMHEALSSSPDITNAEHDGACPEPQILEMEAGGSHVAVHSRRTGTLEILPQESGRSEGETRLNSIHPTETATAQM